MITSGIYKISRNPAFLGFDCVYFGILLMFFNWILLFFSVFAAVMLYLQVFGRKRKVFLNIHGKLGFKEEAESFAEIAGAKGWQVLGIDLPKQLTVLNQWVTESV